MNSPAHRINVTNLRILRDFLQDNFNMVDKHLDMESFCSISPRPQVVLDAEPKDFEDGQKYSCGTTLCLAGWTAVLPDFKEAADGANTYAELINELYCPSMWFFNYLFGTTWDDDLQEGIKRISRIIRAVEEDDTDFLAYLADNYIDVVAVHGKDPDRWEIAADDTELETREQAKLHFPLYETPSWYN